MRPVWTNQLGINWTEDDEVGKLLGTPFGLSLSTHDVDAFLQDKIAKKIKYRETQKINLTGGALVVNSVLLSSLFFFLPI